MKTVALLLVLAVSGLCWLALAENGLSSSNSPGPAAPLNRNAPFVWKIPNTNFWLPPIRGTNRLFYVPPPASAPAAPVPPGVYKAVPYAGLVLVPGPHPDDKCVHRPGAIQSQMPIIKPELRLIPYQANRK